MSSIRLKRQVGLVCYSSPAKNKVLTFFFCIKRSASTQSIAITNSPGTLNDYFGPFPRIYLIGIVSPNVVRTQLGYLARVPSSRLLQSSPVASCSNISQLLSDCFQLSSGCSVPTPASASNFDLRRLIHIQNIMSTSARRRLMRDFKVRLAATQGNWGSRGW